MNCMSRGTKHPFHGATPQNVFQTIDLGSGFGEYLLRQRARFPGRRYAAVDIGYRPVRGKQTPYLDKKVPEKLHASGIRVYPKNYPEALKYMISRFWRARHINMDWPYPWTEDWIGQKEKDAPVFKEVLKLLPRVLFPNGKFYITSDSERTLKMMEVTAEREGYKTRWRRPLTRPREMKKTYAMRKDVEFMLKEGKQAPPVYRLEITFGLKKAFPSKTDRRQWPGKLRWPKSKSDQKL
ncbi:MAG: hypothetical protein HY393_03525 [Candidatus Diapherotrites archaeon]|nr:hypothetical protein [Candidatus Diapherotrites archaeon]